MNGRIFLSPPDVGEEERRFLLEAFDSNWIAPVGPHLDLFERETAKLAERNHALGLCSATAALHLGLRVLGVEPGSEVLMPTLTFVATANAASYLGARPAFLDVSADTWTLEPSLLAEELDRRARTGTLPSAVVTVDLYGQCAHYREIARSCEEHGVSLLEDSAEALGASYDQRPAGSFGALAVFSFNGNKIVTTSGGGVLLGDDQSLLERARYLANQAREPLPHFEHGEVGYNYRLSNLLAALGLAQLDRLERRVEARRLINQRYREALADRVGVAFLSEAPYGRSNCWLTCILVDPEEAGTDRDSLRQLLESHDIEARPTWKPLHLQPAYSDAPAVRAPVAERIFARGLCLPSGSGLSDSDQERVIAVLHSGLPRCT